MRDDGGVDVVAARDHRHNPAFDLGRDTLPSRLADNQVERLAAVDLVSDFRPGFFLRRVVLEAGELPRAGSDLQRRDEGTPAGGAGHRDLFRLFARFFFLGFGRILPSRSCWSAAATACLCPYFLPLRWPFEGPWRMRWEISCDTVRVSGTEKSLNVGGRHNPLIEEPEVRGAVGGRGHNLVGCNEDDDLIPLHVRNDDVLFLPIL